MRSEASDVPLRVEAELVKIRKRLLEGVLQIQKLTAVRAEPDCAARPVLKKRNFVQRKLQQMHLC